MKSNSLSDHYALQEQKSTYYRYLLDKMINQVAEVGSLICITAAVLLALKTLELSQAGAAVERDTAYLEYQYSEKFGHIESQLNTATIVQDTVLLLAELEADTGQSPQLYFGPLSQVLGQERFNNLSLERIEWRKLSPQELTGIISAHQSQLTQAHVIAEQTGLEIEEFGEDPEANPPKRRATMTLHGRIDTVGYSYRSTISRMRSFVSELERLPNIESVLLIRTAVDVTDTNIFEILVILEDANHA